MEGKVAEGLEVASDFLETLLLVFHSKEYIHLENVLCSCEFLVWNWFTEFVELLNHNTHELCRVGAWSLNVHAEKSRVSEMRVDGRGRVNEVVHLHQVGDGSTIHSFAWTARTEGSSRSDESVHDIECRNFLRGPGH